MPTLLEYLLKLSLSLAVVWLFYQLLLRRLTFYNWNRLFLILYSLLSFFIPFINITPILERNELSQNEFIQFIPPLSQKLSVAEKGHGLLTWATIIFAGGILILLGKFILQHISFLRLRRSATRLLDTPVQLYQVDREIIPFSFGQAIFINSKQHSEEELQEILRHELVHVKQKHSIDMFWSELLCILNWYNPFAWLIRKSIRQNLEFIADDKVVQTGVDKKQYQYLLLKVMGTPQYRIATNFNFTSLKKRIAMMNKARSAQMHLVKFLFALPLVAVMLLSFRNEVLNPTKVVSLTSRVTSDTVPATPVKSALPKKVKSIESVNNQVTVTLTDGKKENYNFDKADDRLRFEEKYGSFPEPPAPPTPPQPAQAGKVTPPVVPAPPAGPSLPDGVSGIHIQNNKVKVSLKDGNVEQYDLNKAGDKKRFEQKYGNIIPAEPQVPPAAPTAPVAPVAPVKARATTVIHAEPTVAIDIASPYVATAITTKVDVQPTALAAPIQSRATTVTHVEPAMRIAVASPKVATAITTDVDVQPAAKAAPVKASKKN